MNEARSLDTPAQDVKIAWSERHESLAAVLVMVMLGLGLAAQTLTYINHDVAWVLYSSGHLLEGGEFGRDVVAANPPLIWWISLLPNLISSWTDLPVVGVFRAFVFLGSAVSVYGFRKYALPAGSLTGGEIVLLAALAWLLAFAPHRDFGQREHLAVLFVLPYLAAIIGRLYHRAPNRWQGLLIGAAAGTGIALKPHFVFVPLLVELCFLWYSRRITQLARPEAVGAALAVACYGIALLLFASEWLLSTAPDIMKVYWAFEQPASWRGLSKTLFLPMALCVWGVFVARSRSAILIGAGAFGFLIAAVIQAKFYSYHIYPVTALLVISGLLGTLGGGRRVPILALGLLLAVMVNLLVVAQVGIQKRTPSGLVGGSIREMTEFVERNVAETAAFISISTHPYPGFPTSLYSGREWGSATNSRIFLPAVVRLRTGSAPSQEGLHRFAETQAHQALLRDLRLKPALILVDENPIRHAIADTSFDYLRFYRENAEIDRLLKDYRRIEGAPSGYGAYVFAAGSALSGEGR